ncbi:MAG TPA: DivIVA domain-containing protein [Myxococcaceae bacterium]|nr:DivIVA domain-containing protein [Myxococcaceae bacterium]
MKITPLDIRQKGFESSFRGFSRREVEAFLELVASEFEEVIRENIALKEELRRVHARLEQHHERERTLQETMVTAQRISEDMKAAAKKEAEIILADAEHQAEKIVQGAHQKLVQVIEDINELKRQRVQFESQVRGVIASHARLLDAFSEAPEPRERIDDNVAFFAHKKAASD